MEEALIDVMYELPELNGYEVIITEDVINKNEKQFILKIQNQHKSEERVDMLKKLRYVSNDFGK